MRTAGVVPALANALRAEQETEKLNTPPPEGGGIGLRLKPAFSAKADVAPARSWLKYPDCPCLQF
jgi:hypothetical protein